MGCGAGLKEPSAAVQVEGKYGNFIIDDKKITVIGKLGGHQAIEKVVIKKYKETNDKTHEKMEETVMVVDGCRSEMFKDDVVSHPYMFRDSIAAFEDIQSGMETHVIVHPHDQPPERFVVGYDKDTWEFRVRYDDPERAEALTFSPKKLPKWQDASLTMLKQRNREVRQARKLASDAADKDWQPVPFQVGDAEVFDF